MALFNHATKEVTAKLVYYGPGLCGKTTNLQWIHDNLSFKTKGKLVSLATQTDRTLFFDFLPVELGVIRGMRTRMQIYTVPGQVFYEATRRMVLKGCDAVVFVADSQAAMLDANAESLQSLRRNLLANEIDPSLPTVIQYNKRDLPTALPVAVLNARLNPRNLPCFEAVAIKGTGVEETLKGVTKLLFQFLSRYYGEAEAAGATESTSAPAAAAPSPRAPVTVHVPEATVQGVAAEPVRMTPPAPPPPGPAATPRSAPAVAPPVAPLPAPPATPTVAPRPVPPSIVPPTSVAGTRPAGPMPSAPPEPKPQPPAARPAAPAAPSEEPPAETFVFVKPPSAPPEPRPAARPAAPAAPPEEPPAETFVFVKPQPATAPPQRPKTQLPGGAVPDTISIRPQPVAIPAPAAVKPATPPAPAPMTVPPPLSSGAKLEAPKPLEWTPPVFRDAKPAAPPKRVDPPPKGEGLRSDQWLYLLEGAQRGPIDIEDLIDLLLSSIPEDTKVWHPGLEGWVRANRVRQISDEIPPPVPIPGAARGHLVEDDMPDFNTVPAMLRTVLIADEDQAFRKYLALPLAAQGFTIYEAADGAAAWQLAVQNRPWMILADISMPEVDGFEFCRRVRNHALLSRKPLLFISGSDKYKERYRALQIGADDFLSKQMPIRELLMRIQLLMTRYSDLNASGDQKQAGGPVGGALEGRVEVFGAPALLQICNQGRLSGLFAANAEDSDNTQAVFGFREGEIISAAAGRRSGPEAVYAFLGWEKGSFKFTPGDPGTGQPLAQSVEHLLLEGCRILDESRRGPEDDSAPLQ
jgi:DNA-binding response OmpR family regulator/signal recognition particle receptor subunit beta